MKILFWNVDTQKDFMNKDGALYVEGAESIKGNLKKLTDKAKELNLKVVNTMDYHNPDSKEISSNPDFKTTFPSHCLKETEGCKFIEETCPNDNFHIVDSRLLYLDKVREARNIIIEKDAFDVFVGNRYTDDVLNIIRPDLVIVYGVATNVCVNFVVLGILKMGYKVTVVEDAIKELPNLSKDEIIEKWIGLGAVLNYTDSVVDNMEMII